MAIVVARPKPVIFTTTFGSSARPRKTAILMRAAEPMNATPRVATGATEPDD